MFKFKKALMVVCALASTMLLASCNPSILVSTEHDGLICALFGICRHDYHWSSGYSLDTGVDKSLYAGASAMSYFFEDDVSATYHCSVKQEMFDTGTDDPLDVFDIWHNEMLPALKAEPGNENKTFYPFDVDNTVVHDNAFTISDLTNPVLTEKMSNIEGRYLQLQSVSLTAKRAVAINNFTFNAYLDKTRAYGGVTCFDVSYMFNDGVANEFAGEPLVIVNDVTGKTNTTDRYDKTVWNKGTSNITYDIEADDEFTTLSGTVSSTKQFATDDEYFVLLPGESVSVVFGTNSVALSNSHRDYPSVDLISLFNLQTTAYPVVK